MSSDLDLDAYFARIGYDGPREPTLAVLRDLHRLHPYAIPFENLDVLLKRPIGIDIGAVQDKLVTGGRGGYCFEQNGLFSAVLRALGFRLTCLGARVQWMAPPERVSPRTHMLMKVETLEGPYLADVGFGGLVQTAPLRFEAGLEQDTGQGVYRLVAVGDELQLQAKLPAGWAPMYQFTLAAHTPPDYEMANWYVSTHRASPFTSNLMAAWVTPDRRYGLSNNQLSIHHADGRSEKRQLSPAELDALLHETFGLARPDEPGELAALYERLSGGEK